MICLVAGINAAAIRCLLLLLAIYYVVAFYDG